MALLRQGRHYLIAGLLQFLLDWLVFVAATAAGVPAAPGNLLGRGSGALLGFWLNGRYTFAHEGQRRHGWGRFARYAALWLLMTLISTWLVAFAARALGLQMAWLAKPVVEIALAAVNFFLLRHVVFR